MPAHLRAGLAPKDLRLALEMAHQLEVPGLIAPQVIRLMRMRAANGAWDQRFVLHDQGL